MTVVLFACKISFLVRYVVKGPGGLSNTAEETGQLGRERGQINFVVFRYERRQVAGFRKGRSRQDVPKSQVL